ncbi:polysaccharide biosynthesis tyrosine autokinase [candidate division KSB3 bacterium]|uniref:non-specific protein-tyrosine kinase n=1 Tax=candidate division KSB3 bacterium TaxID=2044937 RepID=A0A9D5JYE9_9BACT|nr:polysaccharide biosynthesis tyrosine autokinase [candidate division KSB3 bacterium]MBD3326036.1 polysaccharide biosynthesis tyrosine autokinase [candidate division KSB3 bacterium]
MFEEEIHLRDYLNIIRRRKWTILAVVFITVVSVTIYTFRQVPIYQASATIAIEKEAPNVLSFQEVMDFDMEDSTSYQTESKILQSRPIAEEVIRKLALNEFLRQQYAKEPDFFLQRVGNDLLAKVQTLLGKPPAPSETDPEAVEDEQLLDAFYEMVSINPIRGSRLLEIVVRAPDRKLTSQIANTLIDVYMARYLDTKLSTSKEAVRWLEKELEDAKQQVRESEQALQAYKENQAIISVQDQKNIVMQKLSELSTAVNQARINRLKIEAQYNQIQDFERGVLDSLPQVVSNSLIRELKVKLFNLESDLSELLKKFRSKHPTVMAVQSQIDAVHEQIDAEIHQIIRSIKTEYDLARSQENDLLAAMEEQERIAVALNQKTVEYDVLQREVESNRRIYDALLQRMKETSVTERLETSNIRIVERAAVPNFPVAPHRVRNILLSLLIGGVIGLTLAFFAEYWDDRIHTSDDCTRYLEIPFLGIIPKVSTRQILRYAQENARETVVPTIILLDPASPVSESYRGLRTNVTFSSLEKGSVMLITSSEPSEGKSSIASNLAIAMAQSGRRTLLIDCDFRRPMIEHVFQLEENGYGFSDMIVEADHQKTRRANYQTNVENLEVIPCGTMPGNPSELLNSAKTQKIIHALKKTYDILILDSPPVNAVTDPVILSHMVADAVLLIIHAGKTKRRVAQYARDQLLAADANILGGILNKVDVHRNGYYYAYQYRKYYRREEKDKRGDQRLQRRGNGEQPIATPLPPETPLEDPNEEQPVP